MTKDDKLSKLGSDLGIFFAGVYTASAAIYLLTNQKISLVIYVIMSAYMIIGSLSMIFFMMFKEFVGEKAKNDIHDSIIKSSVIDKDFILNYLILSIGYSLPFILGGEQIAKVFSATCIILTICMLIKMFGINKILKNEANKIEIKRINEKEEN